MQAMHDIYFEDKVYYGTFGIKYTKKLAKIMAATIAAVRQMPFLLILLGFPLSL